MGRRFIALQNGATAIEYALLMALIAVSSLIAWSLLGQNVASNVSTANSHMADGIDPTHDAGGTGKN